MPYVRKASIAFFTEPCFNSSAWASIRQMGSIHDHAGAAVDEFLVHQLHVHHAVALDASELDHDSGGDHVEDHLLSCARLHP